MRRLCLIDGHSYLYRAFYAIKNLSTKSGLPTNAIYGFINMLLKILQEYKPDMLILAFDSPTPTFRAKRYEEYKAHRKVMPDELIVQIPHLKRLIEAFNFKHLEIPGFEADDILATFADKAEKDGIEDIIIFTNDKDMMQIVNEHITIQTETNISLRYTIKEVIERFGNPPERVPDVLALTGDVSDNIPGITGIGPKTAMLLIQEFHSIDNLIKSIPMIKNEKQKALLEKNIDILKLSHELVLLRKDAPLEINFDDCKIKEPDFPKLKSILQEFEFHNLIQKIIPQENKKSDLVIVDDDLKFQSFIKVLSESSEFAFHAEISAGNMLQPNLVGISFSISGINNFYLPFGHQYLGLQNQLELEPSLLELKPIFENTNIKKVVYNSKSEYVIFYQLGIKINGLEFDPIIASYLLNPSRNEHNLETLAQEYIGLNLKQKEQLTGKGKKIIPIEQLEISVLGQYMCEYTDGILQLKKILLEKIREENLEKVFTEVEIPLIKTLALMEIQGIKLDKNYLNEIKQQIDIMLKKYEKDIFNLAGEEFNINSTLELRRILFDKLQLPAKKKGKTGYSTNVDVLEELASLHDLPLLILNYRQLTKLASTYVDALPELVNPITGRIHTTFNQTITATGRLSSSNPNLQNIPIRSEFGKLIRKAFVVENENFKLISGDYSQIELRFLAHFSNDKNLVQAFQNNEDIHTRTASELFNVKLQDVDANLRRIAKTINFGIIYGMSSYGLSKDLKISPKEAETYIDNYFLNYRDVRKFIDLTIAETKTNGFVKTLLGRKRYIPELASHNKSIQEFGERIAINTPLQGSAADLIKVAMLKLSEELVRKNFKTKMLLQIHDELIFESPSEEVEEVSGLIKSSMENAMQLNVPIVVNIKKGNSWFDLE